MNVSNKVEHNVLPNSPGAVYTQPCALNRETQGFSDKHSCSQVDEELKPHRNDTVNKRHSNLNIIPKRKLTSSSAEPQE